MKKINSSLSNMVLVLVSIALVIGALLAWVNRLTEAPIAAKAEKTLANGIKEVMCTNALTVTGTDTITQTVEGKEQRFVIHSTVDKAGKNLGAAVESTTLGFSGDLKVLVGFDSEGTILGYTILQHSGKGNVIGQNPAKDDLKVNKDGGKVDAITASTITSRAFLKAINQAYSAYVHSSEDVRKMDGKL